ncbi:MAG: hypothetical protein AB9915_00890 [Candidatus Dojkabacteria bacterium]
MEIFLSIWKNWSTYEKLSLPLILLLSFIIILLAVKYLTKNKYLVLWIASSLFASAVLTVFVILLIHIIFDITITFIFTFTPLIILFVNILSLGSSVGYYMENSKNKTFDFSLLKKEFLRDSFQLTAFIFLMFSSLSVFLSSTFFAFILVSGSISLATIWLNYALIYRLVK